MNRGFHDPDLNLNRIIRGRQAQDSSFLTEHKQEEESSDEITQALTLIFNYLKMIDEKNTTTLNKILETQQEILKQLNK